MVTKPKNGLVHGVYVSDMILPWERKQEFKELLAGLRKDFEPIGALENDIVFDIASLSWRKRRVNCVMQLALLQNSFAASAEDSGKRSVDGIRSDLDFQRYRQGRQNKKFMTAVSNLSEAMTSLAEGVKNKKGIGKVGANIRYALRVLEEVQPTIATASQTQNTAEFFDMGPCIEAFSKAFELEARLSGLIDKAIQRLVMAREFQRQYGSKPRVPLSTATLLSDARAVQKKAASVDVNDDNNNNDNDNNDPDNPRSYDWEHEWDAHQKEKAQKTER